MSKLDWSKFAQCSSDPARILRDCGDTTLANTPTARKEAEKKAEARSRAAKQAAQTRKLSKENKQEAARQAVVRDQAAVDFWTRFKANKAAVKRKRASEGQQT